MNVSISLSALSLGTITTFAIALSNAVALALTPTEIDALASQTTVVIGQGLQKGDVENRREWKTGSGVIIAKQGNRYSVLTALHVVRTQNVVYGIRTWDGNVHFVNTSEIHPLGSEQNRGKQINGLDLAVIQFESDHTYYQASVRNAQRLNSGEELFISGWPDPEDKSAYRVRWLRAGVLSFITPNPSVNGQYSLLYSNETRRGMSGGPVFDQDGWLVGIHGRGRAKNNEYCIDPQMSMNHSCGMQTIHFITAAEAANLSLNFNSAPVDPVVIATGQDNKQKADVIQNIYQDFTIDFIPSASRDQPSGTCWGLMLGEDFCDDGI
ncbi:S1 family peptidase [Coleofasciculus sp. F4-SAH-05]|uniref:S1 family peptidase n=1 Tax=Coleofasciculus sp. F4-SAH-05 TaxID=3069525 RepID=UPI003300C78F